MDLYLQGSLFSHMMSYEMMCKSDIFNIQKNF